MHLQDPSAKILQVWVANGRTECKMCGVPILKDKHS